MQAVDDLCAHDLCDETGEETVWNKRQEVVSREELMGELIYRGIRLLAGADIQARFRVVKREGFRKHDARLLFLHRQERGDEETLVIQHQDHFKLLHEGEELCDQGEVAAGARLVKDLL